MFGRLPALLVVTGVGMRSSGIRVNDVLVSDLSPCTGTPDPKQQLNGQVLKVICENIHKKGTNFLVFGLGRDSGFWFKNANNKVMFLENHADWLDFQSNDVKAATHVVKYTTEMQDYQAVLKDEAKLDEFFDSLPAEVRSTEWHTILVDSPMGMQDAYGRPLPGIPGRMQSVNAAVKLAKKDAVIFVDDYDRNVEKESTLELLAPYADLRQVFDNGHGGKTAMFVVNSEHKPRAASSSLVQQQDVSPCRGQPDPQQQLNGEVLKVICENIHEEGANFLVFGLGRDSDFWYKNVNKKVTFLENHQDWLEFQSDDVKAATHVVQYTTEMEDYKTVLKDEAKLNEFFESLPADVRNTKYRTILVDSPMGMQDAYGKPLQGIPGRMQSVHAALKLAKKGTVIFVDDYDRNVEQESTKELLVPHTGEPVVFDNGHGGRTAKFVVQ